jgi:hypothetical protein
MAQKTERNAPCHCGSGKKYKNCCFEKDQSGTSSKIGMIGIIAAVILGLIFVGMAISGGSGGPECPAGTTWSEAHQHCH